MNNYALQPFCGWRQDCITGFLHLRLCQHTLAKAAQLFILLQRILCQHCDSQLVQCSSVILQSIVLKTLVNAYFLFLFDPEFILSLVIGVGLSCRYAHYNVINRQIYLGLLSMPLLFCSLP